MSQLQSPLVRHQEATIPAIYRRIRRACKAVKIPLEWEYCRLAYSQAGAIRKLRLAIPCKGPIEHDTRSAHPVQRAYDSDRSKKKKKDRETTGGLDVTLLELVKQLVETTQRNNRTPIAIRGQCKILHQTEREYVFINGILTPHYLYELLLMVRCV